VQLFLAEAHDHLGNALSDKGQFDAATAADQTILRFNPDSLAMEINLMQTTFGSILVILAISTAAVAQTTRSDGAKQAGPADSDEIVLSFRGQIAGSDQIKITLTEATWHHSFWDMPPEPVTLNGISWDPRERDTLKNEGRTRFLKGPVDFRSARLKRVQARDIVAIEKNKDSVVIHINDTPLGGGTPYEFQVLFRPRNAKADVGKHAGANRATLRIVAEIDGSDELYIDAQGARWVHRHWQWPGGVRLNTVAWNPQVAPVLKNEGQTKFLNGPVDFLTAKMIKKEGRDTAVMEHTDGGVVIYFGDSPFDRSTYEVAIIFGD
jgi:hypothetical protein